MYGIVALQKVQPGKAEEYIEMFKRLQKVVREQEPGNIYYDLYRSRSDENTFHVMERYESKDALKVHGQSEEFQELVDPMRAMLAEPTKAEIVWACS
jgi:quinol monooxygenase YgiN